MADRKERISWGMVRDSLVTMALIGQSSLKEGGACVVLLGTPSTKKCENVTKLNSCLNQPKTLLLPII